MELDDEHARYPNGWSPVFNAKYEKLNNQDDEEYLDQKGFYNYFNNFNEKDGNKIPSNPNPKQFVGQDDPVRANPRFNIPNDYYAEDGSDEEEYYDQRDRRDFQYKSSSSRGPSNVTDYSIQFKQTLIKDRNLYPSSEVYFSAEEYRQRIYSAKYQQLSTGRHEHTGCYNQFRQASVNQQEYKTFSRFSNNQLGNQE